MESQPSNEFFRRLLGRVSRTDYFIGYLTNPSKSVVLVRGLAASVLGIKVMRHNKVLEENATFLDTWGDLEGEGLVALNPFITPRMKKIGFRKEQLITAIDVGDVEVQVQFCPLLLVHLSDKELALPADRTWAFSVPNVYEQGWKKHTSRC
ncbi:hypothetical protein GOP47_0025979 [Adiantum capillus-veneris]|uniref:Uncharacterized protein n=1 Tax=Adiantum capillus-veneris TaxID=13818 RepID=A0A9D4U1H1_ADICA|nr:hypothetical protein GOP47_0025979 [Adiantum capillus-veneris]